VLRAKNTASQKKYFQNSRTGRKYFFKPLTDLHFRCVALLCPFKEKFISAEGKAATGSCSGLLGLIWPGKREFFDFMKFPPGYLRG